eukprot:92369_1
MALFALIFFIAFIVNAHTKSQTLDEHIEEDLSRMARYELIHFDLTQFESNRIISFDAFNEHYLVELEINPHIIMSEIRHFGDDDTLYNPRNLTTSWYIKYTTHSFLRFISHRHFVHHTQRMLSTTPIWRRENPEISGKIQCYIH